MLRILMEQQGNQCDEGSAEEGQRGGVGPGHVQPFKLQQIGYQREV